MYWLIHNNNHVISHWVDDLLWRHLHKIQNLQLVVFFYCDLELQKNLPYSICSDFMGP